MNLRKALTLNTAKVGLKSKTKTDIIEELIDIIIAGKDHLDREILLKAVLDREAQMSTGMKHGIAIPHGKTDSVSELHAVIALSRNAVDFNSLDGEPARIFIMTVSPASRSGPHLEFLAGVSALLNKDDFRKSVLSADSDKMLLDLFLDGST